MVRVAKLGLATGSLVAAVIVPVGACFAQAPAAQGGAPVGGIPDNAATSDDSGIQDIIVTAQKREERVNDIPISVTALSGESLAQRGVNDTADLGKVVPGFTFAKSNFGVPVFTIRGVGFYDTSLAASPAVSAYVDEVPLPFSIMARGAALDLARVEVLKGPQGTLFGQNSTGGAINYIAAKPTAKFEGGVDFGYARFGRITAGGFVSGPISDTLRARFSIRHESGGAWQRSLTRPGDELGDADLTIARLLLDWTPTDRLTVTLNANGWKDNSDTQAAQLIGFFGNPANFPKVAASPLAPANARAADWGPTPSNRLHNDDGFVQVSGKINYDFTDAISLTSISAYMHLDRNSLVDPDGTAAQDYRAFVPGKISVFTQEIRLDGHAPGSDLRWTAGANFEHDQIADRLQSTLTDSRFRVNFLSVDNRYNQNVDTYAVFGNADWTFVPNLTLQGGIRYTDQRRKFEGCLYDSGDGTLAAFTSRQSSALSGSPVVIPPGGCTTLGTDFRPAYVTRHLDESNVSWRSALSWKVAPDKLLYASISRGYKNGSFSTLTATRSASLTPATQESLLAYEAGFKLSLLDRRVQLNGAGYYYDYSDKQIVGRIIDPTLGPVSGLINIPRSRIAGAELQLDWKPVRELTVSAAGTYVDSQIQGNFANVDALGRPGSFGGESFPFTPKWQINGSVEYTHDFGPVELFAGPNVSYRSSTHAGLGNLTQFRIDGYATVDAHLGFRTPNGLTVSGFVNNLTDRYSWNNVVNTTDVLVRYANMPRTYGVNLGYRF